MSENVSEVFESVVANAMKIIRDNKTEIGKFEVIEEISDVFKNK